MAMDEEQVRMTTNTTLITRDSCIYLKIKGTCKASKLGPEEDLIVGIDGSVLHAQFPGWVWFSKTTQEQEEDQRQESGDNGQEAHGDEDLPVANRVQGLLHQ